MKMKKNKNCFLIALGFDKFGTICLFYQYDQGISRYQGGGGKNVDLLSLNTVLYHRKIKDVEIWNFGVT